MALPQITFDLLEAYNTLGPLALIIGGITVYGVCSCSTSTDSLRRRT